MSLAYMLVTGTYMLIGGAFYICFPLPKFCIEDVSTIIFHCFHDLSGYKCHQQNLLNNFHASDVLTVAAKVFLFFQMMTVFPLIMYLLRVSVLYPLFQTVWPGEITSVFLQPDQDNILENGSSKLKIP